MLEGTCKTLVRSSVEAVEVEEENGEEEEEEEGEIRGEEVEMDKMGAEEAPSGVSFSSGNQKQPIFLTKEREKTIPQEKDARDPMNKDKKPEVGDEPLAEDQEEESPDSNAKEAKEYYA